MAQTSKSAKMHTWKIPLLLCLIHSISIPPTNSYCYWSPIHSPRDFYQTYWPTVCLLSELGLKCLYLRPLWGYELRYVLITPVSHHHPLLSVFNLIRFYSFYSFSPWMFFFFLISEGTWVLYISFSFSNLNLNPEDMQVKSTKSTFSFFDIFCLWNHNVSCVFLWPGLYSKLRMKPLTKKVQAVPYDWCYHYTISLSIPSVLWGLFIHTMDSYWSPTLYHAWGYC